MSVLFTKRGAPPVTGKAASDYAVGESVYLNVNGVATEFLVVNQGIPSNSSMYHESCNGTWLLMKNIYETRKWHSSNNAIYADSAIHAYLNGDFLALFDNKVQEAIIQANIPYVNGAGSGGVVASGSGGLSTKIFLLSCYEVGGTTSMLSYFFVDGAALSYFSGTSKTDSKRISYYNNAATGWWLRSPRNDSGESAWTINNSGSFISDICTGSYGIRPALILPFDAKFDPSTNQFLR